MINSRMLGLITIIAVLSLVAVNGQGLWDYNDYNSMLFPQMPFQPNPQHQIQPPTFRSNQNSNFQPAMNSNFQQSIQNRHRLGSPSYRPPAHSSNVFQPSQTFGDISDRSFGSNADRSFGSNADRSFGSNTGYYTGRGNDFVGSSAERSASSSNHGDLDSLLARIVTRMPAIVDQFSQMMSTTTPAPNQGSDFWLPFVQPDQSDNTINKNGRNNIEEDETLVRRAPSTVINSMPDPSAFFSFGKLLNAFTGSGLDTAKFDKQVDPEVEHSIDVESVKGVPILKDEDQESEIIQKPDEELPAAHSLESNETTETTETPELIIFTIPAEDENAKSTTERPKKEDADNLLGSLLTGKLDKVDWLGSIFGSKKDASKSEDGNALAQLFGGNGFSASELFGSAMNDDDKTRKHEDRNFH